MFSSSQSTAVQLVDKATSDLLASPDWALNMQLCDLLNASSGQVKDVVRAVRKRIGSKNRKTQLLALTLLETLIKNCTAYVHRVVAEKDVPAEMAKIARKK
ncbi:unnamed protein product, partial [Closterium sp. NIES-54]